MKQILLTGALCLFTVFVTVAQERLADPRVTYAGTINTRDLKEYMGYLASDEYAGRETGEKGQKQAAKFISEVYKVNNVDHPKFKSGYFQSFELVEISWGNRWIIARDSVFRFFEDFYGWQGQNDSLDLKTNELVFLGYGIDAPNYSDYKNRDVRGKVLIVLDGEPFRKEKSVVSKSTEASEWTNDRELKWKAAMDHGAEALLIIDSKFDVRMGNQNWRDYLDHASMKLKEDYVYKDMCNLLYVSRAMAEELMGKEKLTAAQTKIQKKGKPVYFVESIPMHLKIAKLATDVFSENVAGYVEGSDLKDEVIIVSAHYDHIGIIDGEVYNGADDDASGTVALMEIAQAMQLAKQGGYGPRRSILFLSFAGEEKGLLGSDYYTRHPQFPLENTVANLNIDMVGRIDADHIADSNYIYIIGSNFLSTKLHEINEYNAATYTDLKLDYRFNTLDDPNRFYYRSDHYNFAKNNVPVIFFFNGTHEDYHQASDEIEKISFDILEKRTKLIFHNVWTLANMDERIQVDVVQETE
jgi:hypothetical protein